MQVNEVKISIIIVNWHSEKLIKSQLTRLARLTKCQIIVVDNSNTFDCENEEILVLNGQGNLGFGRAINFAVSRASFEALLFLNPDVEISVDQIIRLFAKWQTFNMKCILSPLSFHSDNSLGSWGKREFPCLKHELLNLLGLNRIVGLEAGTGVHKVAYASGACWLISKQDFQAYGGFDPDFFLYFEETELSYRLRQGQIYSYIDTDLFYIHDESQTMGSAISKAGFFIESKIKFYLKTKSFAKTQLLIIALLELLMHIKARLIGRKCKNHLFYARQIIKSAF